jgi:hypothetical protein
LDTHRSELIAALDRRLWRDLGFVDPEPRIIPFLPSLVVAWADGKINALERESFLERAAELPDELKNWLEERLTHPPGPYFRCQVAHLLAFLSTVWPSSEEGDPKNLRPDWRDKAEEWADELIAEAGWLRRMLGGLKAEIKDLEALKEAMDEGEIRASERIWALARGAHAEGEPERIVAVLEDHDSIWQAIGIKLETEGHTNANPETLAVAVLVPVVRDEDLSKEEVAEKLRISTHLHEPERWILIASMLLGRGRPLTDRQRNELDKRLRSTVGEFELCTFAELAYLEDALAIDARWMSWIPGCMEELHMDRSEVRRVSAPGTFCSARSKVHAHVEQQLVPGPDGLGFRILVIEGESNNGARQKCSLRLASPVVVQEPASQDAVAWIARFLPEMCDPHTQLVLDERAGSWVAEVHSHLPTRPAAVSEPLPPGRALLVPPWIWFRAAGALGVRFFAGRRKLQS